MAPRLNWTQKQRHALYLLKTRTPALSNNEVAQLFSALFCQALQAAGYSGGISIVPLNSQWRDRDRDERSRNLWAAITANSLSTALDIERQQLNGDIDGFIDNPHTVPAHQPHYHGYGRTPSPGFEERVQNRQIREGFFPNYITHKGQGVFTHETAQSEGAHTQDVQNQDEDNEKQGDEEEVVEEDGVDEEAEAVEPREDESTEEGDEAARDEAARDEGDEYETATSVEQQGVDGHRQMINSPLSTNSPLLPPANTSPGPQEQPGIPGIRDNDLYRSRSRPGGFSPPVLGQNLSPFVADQSPPTHQVSDTINDTWNSDRPSIVMDDTLGGSEYELFRGGIETADDNTFASSPPSMALTASNERSEGTVEGDQVESDDDVGDDAEPDNIVTMAETPAYSSGPGPLSQNARSNGTTVVQLLGMEWLAMGNTDYTIANAVRDARSHAEGNEERAAKRPKRA